MAKIATTTANPPNGQIAVAATALPASTPGQPEGGVRSGSSTAPKVLATVLGATGISAVAGALHFIGHCAHAKWMSYWGLEAHQIPIDTADKFALGYSALLDGFTTVVAAASLRFAAPLVGLLTLLGLLWVGATTLEKRLRQNAQIKDTLHRAVPKLAKVTLLVGLVSLFSVIWLYCAGLTIANAMSIGPAIGNSFGQRLAQRQEELAKQGCKRAEGHAACTEMKRDDKVIAKGVLLAASSSQVLIYDVNENQPRLLPAEGVQFSGWQP